MHALRVLPPLLALWLALAACGSSGPEATPEGGDGTGGAEQDGIEPHDGTTTGATTAGAGSGQWSDDPRISTSGGTDGSVVILWPRVIPATAATDVHDVATAIQARLSAIAARAMPGHTTDVRPEPQRACPQAGCTGTALGALLITNGAGCVVLGLVARPGRSPTRIVPWSGSLELRQTDVPFRAPPESQVRVHDYQSCADLAGSLSEHEADIDQALRIAGGE